MLTEECEDKEGRTGLSFTRPYWEPPSQLKLLTISRFFREGGNDGEESIGVRWEENIKISRQASSSRYSGI